MITFENTAKRTTRYAAGGLILLAVAIVSTSWIFGSGDDQSSAMRGIALRKIGHEVLLQAGDSTSRVLPVQKLSDEWYQVGFDRAFTFKSDSLVSIVQRSLQYDKHLPGYMVHVKSRDSGKEVYGFAVANNTRNTVIPCRGRVQPKGDYLIELQWNNEDVVSMRKAPLIAGLSVLAFIGLVVTSPFRIRRRGTAALQEPSDIMMIGRTSYHPTKGQLLFDGMVTELTPKENRLLRILADHRGEIVERTRLQKELWEDEGVIVGRSLDVFISRLRKKMEHDKSIELKNIHGKGYRLES